MRDIKFRGKTTVNFPDNKDIVIPKNKWICGGITYDTDRVWIDCPYYGEIKVDKNTIGQYTGLKDKNRKEIYEGDIVRIPDSDLYGINAGEKYEVYFAYGGFRLKPKYKSKSKGYWLEDDAELEVIGNIYDNPELLEEKK